MNQNNQTITQNENEKEMKKKSNGIELENNKPLFAAWHPDLGDHLVPLTSISNSILVVSFQFCGYGIEISL
jgi:hypothetical protein